VSVLCESVPVDPQLRAQAMSLFAPIGWHGVAMAEYKEDRRTGRPVLMEVNGRFWGSMQLAVDAGVDFPYLSYQLALGRPLDLPRAYKIGVKSRWLLGDLDHLLIRLLEGPHQSAGSMPSKTRALVEFLRGGSRGARHEVFRGDDPRPMAYELAQYARALLRLKTSASHGDFVGAHAPFGDGHVGAVE
jgi:predicted ATP-grasp superfamily ATP-dependent carboligase